MRRIATAVLIAAALALTAVPALADTTVTYAGPVKAGTELVLTCPEGHTGAPEGARFYRDPTAGSCWPPSHGTG